MQKHFLLYCSSYLYLGRNLLARTHALIRPFGFANLSNEAPTKLSLYGDNNLAHHVNREILQLILNCIHDSKRLIENCSFIEYDNVSTSCYYPPYKNIVIVIVHVNKFFNQFLSDFIRPCYALGTRL